MNSRQQLLYKVLRNFEGMSKLDAFDLLHKIEVLLFYAKSPIKNKEIKEVILSDIDTPRVEDPFQFTILPNGNFCESVGANDWIHIYKEVRRGIGKLSPRPNYYYKTKYESLALLKLNNHNLLDSVLGTAHEHAIISFSNNYSITAKDRNTGRLLLISCVE